MSDKKNIIISGYPKSGTIWTSRLVAQLLDCPVTGYWGKNEYSIVREGQERESDFCCYQSHDLFHELPQKNSENIYKIIYVVRDPRDIVVSGAFHFGFYPFIIERTILRSKIRKTRLGKMIKKIGRKLVSRNKKFQKMIEVIKHGTPYIHLAHNSWKNHVVSYLDKDILILKYEDLMNQGLIESKKILDFVSYQKKDAQLLADIKSQSFSTRKQEFESKRNNLKSAHLRKGKVGEWKHYLSENQNIDIQKHMGDLMQNLGYDD